MDFGWLLDRVWVDFGIQVGAKLGPCWAYVGSWAPQKEHSKNMSKNTLKKEAGRAENPGGGPLEQRKTEEKGYQGDKNNAKGTPRRTRRGGGYIYVYIYIYICICVCICIYIYLCIYIVMFMYVSIYMYIHHRALCAVGCLLHCSCLLLSPLYNFSSVLRDPPPLVTRVARAIFLCF